MVGYLLWIPTVRAQAPVMVGPVLPDEDLTRRHPDSAYIVFRQQLQLHQKNKENLDAAICLQQIGQALFHLGNYAEAVDNLLQADNLLRQLSRKDILARNMNLLGEVYYYNQLPADALGQFQEALQLYHSMGNPLGVATTYGQIGRLYEKRQMYDSARFFQRQALNQALQGNDQLTIAKIYENIGSIFEDEAVYDSAGYYFRKSLEMNLAQHNMVGQIEVINNIGDIYSKTGNYRQGLHYAREAMLLAEAMQEKYQLQSACRDMGQNFAAMGDYDSAYYYLEKSRQLIQEIYAADNSRQIAMFQTLYDTARKNAEIDRLNADRKLDTTINIAVLSGLLLLGLLGAVVISRQKLKIRNERAINDRNQQVFDTQRDLMESELKRNQLEEENLKQQLETKSRALSSQVLHLIQKNDVLEELKKGLTDMIKDDKRDQKKQLKLLLQKINFNTAQDAYWDEFRHVFDQVHESFFTRLRDHSPELSASDIRLLALIRMNIHSTDIAKLLGITPDSLRVTRYRVKKKMGLTGDESLSRFIKEL